MTQQAQEGHIIDPIARKLFQTLFQNPDKEFNKTDLAEEAEISRDALYRRWDKIEQLILEEKGSNYKLNQETEQTQDLKKLLSYVNEL